MNKPGAAKSWIRFCANGLLVIVALSATRAVPASAANYQFINIADSSAEFSSNQFGGASINNSGLVAFSGVRNGVQGIYAGSGGPIATIADSTGALSGLGSPESINDSGMVAFNASLDTGGEGLFTGSGGPITPVIDSSGPFSYFNFAVINNGGTIAFSAFLDGGGSGIYATSGGAPMPIAELGGDLSFVGFGEAVINNNGTVAFCGFSQGGTIARYGHLYRQWRSGEHDQYLPVWWRTI